MNKFKQIVVLLVRGVICSLKMKSFTQIFASKQRGQLWVNV